MTDLNKIADDIYPQTEDREPMTITFRAYIQAKREAYISGLTDSGMVKALQKIAQMSDPGSYEKAIVDMKRIASDALAGINETKNK